MAYFVIRDGFDHDFLRPSRLLDQHFGLGLGAEDLLAPLTIPSRPAIRGNHYYRPWRAESNETGSVVKHDTNNFQVNLDVQQFKPEEISVKVKDDYIVVEGKHEERADEHGYISRQFVRRYQLPKGYEISQVASSLSSDGVLTISAPKTNRSDSEERVISITHTGPHKAVKSGEGDKDEKEN